MSAELARLLAFGACVALPIVFGSRLDGPVYRWLVEAGRTPGGVALRVVAVHAALGLGLLLVALVVRDRTLSGSEATAFWVALPWALLHLTWLTRFFPTFWWTLDFRFELATARSVGADRSTARTIFLVGFPLAFVSFVGLATVCVSTV